MSSPGYIESLVRKDRYLVLAALALVIVGCWLYLLTGAGMGMYPQKMTALVPESMQAGPSSPSMSAASNTQSFTAPSSMGDMIMTPAAWTAGYALLMFGMWWLMMIAMMLPSAAPMILLHAAITRKSSSKIAAAEHSTEQKRNVSNTYPAITAFTGGYIVIWAGFSLLAVLAQWALEGVGLFSGMMMTTSKLLGAGLLIAAGIWQLTPLKNVCLRHCRSPIAFVSAHWRPGVAGAFRMGIEHGAFCLGCCWFLMLLLFYGGVMNLVWIIGLAVFVLVEKLLPYGAQVGRYTGVLLMGWGAFLVFDAVR